MTQFLSESEPFFEEAASSKVLRQVLAMRRNKDVIRQILNYLAEDIPNASAAREALEEIEPRDRIDIWSCSTKAGGFWETWERDALKYGDLTTTGAYSRHCQRTNDPGMKKLIMAEGS